MATGYTQPVADGKISTLREFATSCARAFGANVTMRDEPMDAPIIEYKPNAYHVVELEKAKARLFDAERMSIEDATRLARASYDESIAELEAANVTKAKVRSRYELMLSKVQPWVPPTEEHREFKKFMLQQLQSSIDMECDPSEWIKPLLRSGKEHIAMLIERATLNIAYHTTALADEERRCAQRNAWNSALFASLVTS